MLTGIRSPSCCQILAKKKVVVGKYLNLNRVCFIDSKDESSNLGPLAQNIWKTEF